MRLHRAQGSPSTAISSRMQESMSETFPFLGQRCDRIVQAVLARLSALPRPTTQPKLYLPGRRPPYRMPLDEGMHGSAIGRPLHRMRLQRVGTERCHNERRRSNERRGRCSSLLGRSESQARRHRRRHRDGSSGKFTCSSPAGEDPTSCHQMTDYSGFVYDPGVANARVRRRACDHDD